MYFNLQVCVHLKRLQNMIVHGHVATLADAHIYIVGRSYMYELFNWLAKKLVTRLVALLKAPLTVLSHVLLNFHVMQSLVAPARFLE